MRFIIKNIPQSPPFWKIRYKIAPAALLADLTGTPPLSAGPLLVVAGVFELSGVSRVSPFALSTTIGGESPASSRAIPIDWNLIMLTNILARAAEVTRPLCM